MPCNKSEGWGYLADFTGRNPLDAVICPFAGGNGAGLGEPLVVLLLVSFMGLGLSIRAQHPGPILVVGILSAGLVATSMAGIGAQLFAIVLFFGTAAVAFLLYQRASTSL